MSEPKQLPSRAENLKRVREQAMKDIASAPLVTHVAKAMKTSVVNLKPNEKLDQQYHWDSDGGKIVVAEKRNGEQYIRYVHEEYEKRNRIITCEPMMVVDSCLGEDGNLNVARSYMDSNGEEKTYTESNPKKAKYELKLAIGVPEAISENYKKKLDESQPRFLNSVKELMSSMWDEGIKAGIYDEALGEQKVESWMKKQTSSFIKSDGSIELKRSIQTYRGDPNPVRYWKKTKQGHVERFNPTEIPKGALVIAQYYPKPYCFKDNNNEWKYGSTAELGRDLIVVWMPKPRTKEEISEAQKKSQKNNVKDALADVPFFEF
jgi:hypothetical protein